jgi:hypothetical protein
LCILGFGASATWKEGNHGLGLLEWFAWSEAVEITIEGKSASALQHVQRMQSKELYAVLELNTFCKELLPLSLVLVSEEFCTGVDRDGFNLLNCSVHLYYFRTQRKESTMLPL